MFGILVGAVGGGVLALDELAVTPLDERGTSEHSVVVKAEDPDRVTVDASPGDHRLQGWDDCAAGRHEHDMSHGAEVTGGTEDTAIALKGGLGHVPEINAEHVHRRGWTRCRIPADGSDSGLGASAGIAEGEGSSLAEG